MVCLLLLLCCACRWICQQLAADALVAAQLDMSGRWGSSIIYGLCQMGKTREALFTAWLSWFRQGLVPVICVKGE
jgi:hypothetical protein